MFRTYRKQLKVITSKMSIKKKIRLESAVYLISNIIMQVLAFLSIILLMKYLPIEVYGQYTYNFEFVLLIGIVAETGFRSYYTRTFSQSSQIKNTYKTLQFTHFIISILLLVLILILAKFTQVNSDVFTNIVILSIGYICFSFLVPINSLMISKGEKKYIVYKDILTGFTKLVLVVVVIYFNLAETFLYLIYYLLFIILTILYFIIKNTNLQYSFLFNYSISKNKSCFFLKKSLPFTILVVSNVLYNKLDVVMLENFKGVEEVAIYAGAYKFIYPFMFISSIIMFSVLPKLSKYHKQNSIFREITDVSVTYLLSIGIFLSFSLLIFSEELFKILFENKFEDSIFLFQLLVPYLPVVFFYGVYTNLIVSKHKEKFMLKINILMLFANFLLNLIVIPAYGAMGATLSTLVCEILIFFITAIFVYKNFNIKHLYSVSILIIYLVLYYYILLERL